MMRGDADGDRGRSITAELSELVAELTRPRRRRRARACWSAACSLAWIVVPPDARPRSAGRARSGSATASSTACCSRCSRSASPSPRAGARTADQAGGVQGRDPDPDLAGRDPPQRAGAERDVPAGRLGADRRAQHLVAGLDRRRAVGHRRAAARCSTRWTTCTGRSARPRVTLRNVVEGTLTAGVVLVLALWISAAIEKRLLQRPAGHDLSLRKMGANVVRAVLLFVGLLFALSAVGHRPDRAVGARRRDRRGPRLRPAEDRRQLRQRLRHPRRAQPAHRRHGEGRQLRGPHHRHPDPLHGDPLARRPRVDRPERDADHAAGRELVARRSARADQTDRAGRPTAPMSRRCSRSSRRDPRAMPRVLDEPAPAVQLGGLRRRRHGPRR